MCHRHIAPQAPTATAGEARFRSGDVAAAPRLRRGIKKAAKPLFFFFD